MLPPKLLNSIVKSRFTHLGQKGIANFFPVRLLHQKNISPKKNQKSKVTMFDFFYDEHFPLLIVSCKIY